MMTEPRPIILDIIESLLAKSVKVVVSADMVDRCIHSIGNVNGDSTQLFLKVSEGNSLSFSRYYSTQCLDECDLVKEQDGFRVKHP